MAENKTKATKASVKSFLDSIENESKRNECKKIAKLFAEITGEKPVMWGDSIVGFGSYHYKYESGREGDSCIVGFSPRARNISLYIMPGYGFKPELRKKLGNIKEGKTCIYLNSLDDINLDALKKLTIESVKYMRKLYP